MTRRKATQETSHWFQPRYGLEAIVRDEDGRWWADIKFAHDETGQRLIVEQVTMHRLGTATIDVAAWRSFPIAKIESTANVPYMYRLIVGHEHATVNPEQPRGRRLVVGPAPTAPVAPNPYPERHYQRIADIYTFHVEHGVPPAKRMAEDWNVPITTVNRWVKEARARGYLPPARSRGRAG